MSSPESFPPPVSSADDTELRAIREALRGLRYGSVTIILQDGVIVQIDRTEKRRIRKADVSERRADQS